MLESGYGRSHAAKNLNAHYCIKGKNSLSRKYYDKVDLCFSWILPYKQLPTDKDGNDYYLVIANNDDTVFKGDTQGFATSRYNNYTYCRWTDNKKTLLSPLAVLHWSFCRTEEEVDMKINKAEINII